MMIRQGLSRPLGANRSLSKLSSRAAVLTVSPMTVYSRRWALPAALVAWALVYPAAFRFRVVPFWSALVALSAFTWWAAWHPYLNARLRPDRRLVAMGLASGLALYVLFCAGAVLARVIVRGPPSCARAVGSVSAVEIWTTLSSQTLVPVWSTR